MNSNSWNYQHIPNQLSTPNAPNYPYPNCYGHFPSLQIPGNFASMQQMNFQYGNPYNTAADYQYWMDYYRSINQIQFQQHSNQALLSPSCNVGSLEAAGSSTEFVREPSAVLTVDSSCSSSNAFVCEPCEKSFKCSNSYQSHLLSHEACKHPGCDFQASKKIVAAHFHSKHGQYNGTGFKMIEVEGQQFKVLLGTSPAEVHQWRLERKNRFPTETRIKQLQEKIHKNEASGGLSQKRKVNNTESNSPPNSALFQLVGDYSSDTETVAKDPICKKQRVDGSADKPSKTAKRTVKNKAGNIQVVSLKENLLNNLLKSTINKEENIVLQCIKFSISSDYFQD